MAIGLGDENAGIRTARKLDALILAQPKASNKLVAIDDANDGSKIDEARAELKRAAEG